MRCPNCGTEHTGEFCNQCGQSNVDLHVPVGDLAREAVEEAVGFDSRLRHTLKPFFLQPGELTRDYLSGRRVRYTSPLKMYLVASVLFFLAAARTPSNSLSMHIEGSANDPSAGSPDEGLAQGLSQGFRETGSPHRAAKKPEGRIGKFVAAKLDALASNREAPRELASSMLNLWPKAMFVLVPLFAWLLKKLWRARFYAEHLIFALHFHAFAMLLWIPSTFASGKVNDALSEIALTVSAVYLFLALRRVYGDGVWRTLAKMFSLGLSYMVLFVLAMGTIAIASMFMI